MGDFVEFLILMSIGTVVGLVVGGTAFFVSYKKDIKNQPEQSVRGLFLEEVRMQREGGMPYQERFIFLKEKGLRKKVTEKILAEDIRINS